MPGVDVKEITANEYLTSDTYAPLRAGEGQSGGFWGPGSNVTKTLDIPYSRGFATSQNGQVMGVAATAPLFHGVPILGPLAKFLGVNHISYVGYSATGDVINSMGRIAFWQYGTLTTCDQATITAMAASGIPATTAIGIGGWSVVATSFLYGTNGMSGSGVLQGYMQYMKSDYE